VKAGKLPPHLLRDVILNKHGQKRTEVIVPAALGEDSAVVDLQGDYLVISSDPITGAANDIGWFGVHISCNDIAAGGGEPLGILLTILLPLTASEADLDKLMTDAHRAAKEVGIEIIGGHTEVTPGINQTILMTTAIGRAKKEKDIVSSAGLQPGDFLLLTKGAGLEGTAILASEYEDELKDLVNLDVILRAKAFSKEISIVPEARLAIRAGAKALHDVTEGGVLGALYEMAEASSVGLAIEEEKIMIRKETKLICSSLDISPLKLISSGALLIGIAKENLSILENLFDENDIPYSIIGQAMPRQKGLNLIRGYSISEIDEPESDELWRLKERFGL